MAAAACLPLGLPLGFQKKPKYCRGNTALAARLRHVVEKKYMNLLYLSRNAVNTTLFRYFTIKDMGIFFCVCSQTKKKRFLDDSYDWIWYNHLETLQLNFTYGVGSLGYLGRRTTYDEEQLQQVIRFFDDEKYGREIFKYGFFRDYWHNQILPYVYNYSSTGLFEPFLEVQNLVRREKEYTENKKRISKGMKPVYNYCTDCPSTHRINMEKILQLLIVVERHFLPGYHRREIQKLLDAGHGSKPRLCHYY